jgi:hypothetical protein
MPCYPMPDDNPFCQCQGHGLKQMFCSMGHLTECHAGYACKQAGCAHLYKYDLDPGQAQRLALAALGRLTAGKLPPYQLDSDGNVMIVPQEKPS